jgi:Flp pilus assembly protein TadD
MIESEKELTLEESFAHACYLFRVGDKVQAENVLRAVLTADRNHPDALNQLGVLLVDKGKLHEALYLFNRAVSANRKWGMLLSNRGMVLGELGDNGEALLDHRRAVHLEPNNAVCWNNLSISCERNGLYEEALMASDRSLGIDPENAVALHNRGVVLIRLVRHDEAMEYFNRCLAIEPDYPDAHYNLGTCHLLRGNFEDGFREYEWRTRTVGIKPYYIDLPCPKWTGDDSLAGKSIIIHAEQGMGDVIQFSRYLPKVAALGPSKIYLILHSGLKGMFSETFPEMEILKYGETLPTVDFQLPMMSLPLVFQTRLTTVPPPTRFITDPARIAWWDRLITGVANDRKRVGICWSGNWQHQNDAQRSVPLKLFARMLDRDDVAFFNVLKDVRPMEREMFKALPICDLGSKFRDFRDTAAAMRCLDLVISADTSVAHMAASLGLPTWILIPKFCIDWRWMRDRSDSPWYPSATLFRQDAVGDWASVMRRVDRALSTHTNREVA